MNEKNLAKFLFAWVLIGYVSEFDFFQVYSCVVGFHLVDGYNITFTIVSLGIIGFIINSKNSQLKKLFIVLELTIWLFKLMVFKGGYNPFIDSLIFSFDIISMGLRLLLICYVFELEKLKLIKIILVASLFFSIKIKFLADPYILEYEKEKSIQEATTIKSQMIGTWIGFVNYSDYVDYKEIDDQFSTKIFIDSSSIFFKKIPLLQHQYLFKNNYSNIGQLINSENTSSFDFRVLKITNDSLVFKMDHYFQEYLFKLKRKND